MSVCAISSLATITSFFSIFIAIISPDSLSRHITTWGAGSGEGGGGREWDERKEWRVSGENGGREEEEEEVHVHVRKDADLIIRMSAIHQLM